VLACAVLKRDGFRVASATSGEAMARVPAVAPDLILLDVGLAAKDGNAFTNYLKADPTTSTIPIVALTDRPADTFGDPALFAGCSGYITKPIDTTTLTEKVRPYLDPPLI
jgi:CheY-like chemotaxis protein